MRYIDADRMANGLERAMERMNVDKSTKATVRFFIEGLQEYPTADVVEVKYARWKGAGMGGYYCSLCQEIVSGNEFKYCPNCGAKMDGGDKQ